MGAECETCQGQVAAGIKRPVVVVEEEEAQEATQKDASIANELDPFTMESVGELGRDGFRISTGTRGLHFMLSARGLARSIRTKGEAVCPYTRRALSDMEVARLDRALGLCMRRSCWYAVASGEARREASRTRALVDSVLGLDFVAREMLSAVPPISVAALVVVLRRAVRSLCRRFGGECVSSAIVLQARDHAEQSSMRCLLRRLARAALSYGR